MSKQLECALRWVFLIAFFSGTAQAAEQESEDYGEPDADFLEFLGSFEGDDGNWIDPQVLIDAENADSKGGDHE